LIVESTISNFWDDAKREIQSDIQIILEDLDDEKLGIPKDVKPKHQVRKAAVEVMQILYEIFKSRLFVPLHEFVYQKKTADIQVYELSTPCIANEKFFYSNGQIGMEESNRRHGRRSH